MAGWRNCCAPARSGWTVVAPRAGQRLEAGQAASRFRPLGDAALPSSVRAAARHAPFGGRLQGLMRSLVLYRDDAVIAINKPAGLAVQGGSKMSRHLDGMLDGLRFGSAGAAAPGPSAGSGHQRRSAVGPDGRRGARASLRIFAGRMPRSCTGPATIGVPDREEGMIDLALAKADRGRTIRRRSGRARSRMSGRKAVTAYRVHRSCRQPGGGSWPCGRRPAGPISCGCIARRSAIPSWEMANTAARRPISAATASPGGCICTPAGSSCRIPADRVELT